MKTISSQLPNALQPACRAHVHETFDANRIPHFAQRETVAPGSRPAAPAVKKILVPIELSHGSGDTLALATQLARKSRAATRVFSCGATQYHRRRTRNTPNAVVVRNVPRRGFRIEAIGRPGRRRCVGQEVVVSDGRPPAEGHCGKPPDGCAADALVISARPHRRWLQWLHRNTASNVIRQAPCPVVLISADKQKGGRKQTQSPRAGKTSVNIVDHENTNLHQSVLRVLFS